MESVVFPIPWGALPARRPAPDAGRHGGVLQSGFWGPSWPPRRRETSSPFCGPSEQLRIRVSGFWRVPSI